MSKFEKALADALAEKVRREELMRNPQYSADIKSIKEFINANTGFRLATISVEKGDITIIKLRAKEQY